MTTALIVLSLIIFLVLFYVAGRLEFWAGRRGFDLMRRSRGDVHFGYEEDHESKDR